MVKAASITRLASSRCASQVPKILKRLTVPARTLDSYQTNSKLRNVHEGYTIFSSMIFQHWNVVRRDVLSDRNAPWVRFLPWAIAEIPEPLQSDYKTGKLQSINWQLSAQSDLYEGRLRWADAAARLCELVGSRRHELIISEHGVEFQNDDDIEEFNTLLATIEEVHQSEVAALQERAPRFAASTDILGAVQRT